VAGRFRGFFELYTILPQLRNKFGERAISHAGPAARNSVPERIRAEPDNGVLVKSLMSVLELTSLVLVFWIRVLVNMPGCSTAENLYLNRRVSGKSHRVS